MGTIRHATLTSELAGGSIGAGEWDAAHDISLAVDDITGLQAAMDGLTGWGAYFHTGAAQAILANTAAALTNNAGSVIEAQKPADVSAFYSAGKITGRDGDGIGLGIEFSFTPSSAAASMLSLGVDIGGSVGEIFIKEYPITRGSGVAHKISYNITAYTLTTWAANGGTPMVLADGPGSITGTRCVIHRLHKAR